MKNRKKRAIINTRSLIILLFQAVFLFFCASGVMGQSSGGMNTAKGSIGKREVAPTGPMYTGNGGSNIRLAVLAPEVQGSIPDYLPLYIQGLLNNNIKKFSAVNLIDRQNLNRIIAEQNLAASGRFSDRDFVSIGTLTNAQYFLFGTIQKLSGNKYSLQLSVTEASTGVRKASFMKDGTSAQFEENGTIINEATAELLGQLGIQLTAAGKQTLLAGNTVTALAEAGLAKGITAQAGGAEIKALFNFAQAVSFDPSQLEALSRLSALSTSISGGTISQRIINDIQARDKWLEVFKETAKFYNDHPPFEIIFDPSLVQIGETDYVKRTANLGMRIALDPSEAGFKAINTLIEGLEKTERRSAWGFSNWPLTDIAPKTAGTILFDGKQTFSCKIDVSLLNEKKKNLGKSSITINSERIWSTFDYKITIPGSIERTVTFPNVKVDDLTPSLIIVIDAVNGIKAQKLNASGYMKIETGDLEKRISEREAAAQVPYDQGKKNLDTGNYDQAILYFTQAIQINPYFVDAYNYRGDVYFYSGKYDQAIADYTEAIRLDPKNVFAYYSRGGAYYYKGDYNKAITDCTQAIRLDPNEIEAYRWRAKVYYSKKDYNKAIADYTQAIRLDPNDSYAYAGRGDAYFRKKDYNKAIADYTEEIRLDPNSDSAAYAYNLRGNAYTWIKNWAKAKADYEAAYRLDPNNSVIKDNYYDSRSW